MYKIKVMELFTRGKTLRFYDLCNYEATGLSTERKSCLLETQLLKYSRSGSAI